MLSQDRKDEKSQAYILQLAEKLKSQGVGTIRADLPGYDAPSSFRNPNEDYVLTPDLTVVGEYQKSYYDIAQKTDETRLLVTKWKLMQQFASLKNGAFKIFVPRGHMRFTRDLVEKFNIEAQVVKL